MSLQGADYGSVYIEQACVYGVFDVASWFVGWSWKAVLFWTECKGLACFLKHTVILCYIYVHVYTIVLL